MLTIALFFMNLVVTVLGIYIFDYQVDGVVNSPLVIIVSILAGWIIMILLLVLYIEGAYYLIARNRPKTSMFKHKIAKQMVSIPMHVMNMRIKVVGLENLPKDPGFSIYANHTSMFDIPLLMYKLYEYPVAFLEKEKLVNVFMFGKWTPVLGCVTIDRSNDRKGAEAIINVIKNVKSGSSMVIFPEGTRSKEIGTLLEFKQGSFKVALKSKAPLVPMTIVKPKNYKDIKWPFKKRTTLVIHKPIPYEEFKTMKSLELSEQVKEIIESSLNTIY
jgi:1-acyl-sn-glycerol-3-phosphate acyltransferase